MTIWYRASPSPQSEHVFSGDGGLYTAGRWHHQGHKVIYCSESIALCTIEWLCHNGLSVSAFNYFRYSIDIPDKLIHRFTLEMLPPDWSATPASNVTRDFAEQHLFQQTRYTALAVPSVLIPEEYNLIINPLHASFQEMIKSIQPLGQYIAPNR